MKAGEALFFDDRLIHGSLHNPTAEDRIAMISGMIPREADFIMYLNHDGLQWPDMELFEVDEDILLKLEIGKRPEGYKSQGVFKLEIPTLTRAEIVDMITCPTIL
jgi:Tfp pilus assembly protein PilZ